MKLTPAQINTLINKTLEKAANRELRRLLAAVPGTIPRIRGGSHGGFVVASSKGFDTYSVTAEHCNCPYFAGTPYMDHGKPACKHTLAVRALLALLPAALAPHLRNIDDAQALAYATAHPWTYLIVADPEAKTSALYDPGAGFYCNAKLVNGLYIPADRPDEPWLYQWFLWADLPPAPPAAQPIAQPPTRPLPAAAALVGAMATETAPLLNATLAHAAALA